MKEIQRRKVRNNTEKPFPGCLGRMVNLFDLSAGVNRNKLLTDKPHRDGDYPPLFSTNACLLLFSPNCFPNLYDFFFEGLTICYYCEFISQRMNFHLKSWFSVHMREC